MFGQNGFSNDINRGPYLKTGLSRPYKFLVHVVVQCLGHRKGGYEETIDYQMCIIATLCLNLKYNFSKVYFDNMKHYFEKEKWLMYPHFIQMIVEDHFPGVN